MADLVKVIDPGGGEDYTKLADFESAYDGNDWSANDNLVAQVKGVPNDANIVYWNGWSGVTQSSSHRLVIEAYAGQETDFTDDHAGGRIEDRQYVSDSNVLYMDWKSLEFHVSVHDALQLGQDGGGEVRVTKSMFRDSGNKGILAYNNTVAFNLYVGGCLGKGLAGANYDGFVNINDEDVTCDAINCMAYDCQDGFAEYSGTLNCKNCAAAGNAATDIRGGVTETTCLEEDDGELTTNDADDFTAPSTDDFHVYDINSALYHSGTAVVDAWFTSLVATDIDGTSWAAPNPSVGCYEYPAAGGITLTVAELAGAGVLDSFALTQKHAITVQELLSNSSLDNIALTQKHLLALQELLSSGTLDTTVLTQKHGIIIQELSSAGVIEETVLTQKHLLALQELLSSGAIDNVALSQKHLIAIQELLGAGAIDNVSLIQKHLLALQELLSSGIIDNVSLAQKHLLTVQELLSSGTLDNIELVTAILLAVADLISAGALDSKTLIQKHTLAIQEMLGGATLDSIHLTQKHLLAVQELLSSGTLDNVELSLAILLVIADLLSSGALDTKSLTQKHNITIQELLSSCSLDVPVLTQKHILAVQELLSTSTLDALNLIAATLLVVADLVSSGGLDGNVLTQKHILTVQEVLSAGLLDGVALTQKQLLAIQDLLSSGLIDSINFNIATGLICITLSKATEYNIALSHKGGGVC